MLSRFLLWRATVFGFLVIAGAGAAAEPTAPDNTGRIQLSESLDRLAARQTAQRRARIDAIATRTQAEARQRQVRSTILTLLGGLPERTPLKAEMVGTLRAEGFRIEKILFESQPGFRVTALLYVPDAAAAAPVPAIVLAPGHSPAGKASDVAFAAAFARNGIAVLSYDPIGQGERLQYRDPATGKSLAVRPTGEHGELGLQPTLIGETAARYFLWDGMRAVDYLQSRPEIDAARIGAFGCSGGGAMTALLGALDPRIKVMAAACYITSFDTLLPALGPQDAEQSIPRFIASGLDFPDWVELAAPRPYAIVSTTGDMFPFAGAQSTEAEARRFYRLFGAENDLDFITGPGGHGNLGPIQGPILSFFLRHLRPDASSAAPALVPPSPPGILPLGLSAADLQVTRTGQISGDDPDAVTVHKLTLHRFAALPPFPGPTGAELRRRIRAVTGAVVLPTVSRVPTPDGELAAAPHAILLATEPDIILQGVLAVPTSPTRHPAVLWLTNAAAEAPDSPGRLALIAEMRRLADAGTLVLAIAPRPSPPGSEEIKAPILGPFYLTELRAELTGKTLMGLRIDDTVQAVDYLERRSDVDHARITARAGGHFGLVLLHEAVLDWRLSHISIEGSLISYRSLMESPLPIGAPEDILPDVLSRYDLPDLVRALGGRADIIRPLDGTDDLSAPDTP